MRKYAQSALMLLGVMTLGANTMLAQNGNGTPSSKATADINTLVKCNMTTAQISGLPAGSCSFTSTIDLVLQTTSAHTFNFIFPNVGQGVYTLKVKAAVASGASIISGNGTAVGAAAFGLGSMTAETVRFVHDFSF